MWLMDGKYFVPKMPYLESLIDFHENLGCVYVQSSHVIILNTCTPMVFIVKLSNVQIALNLINYYAMHLFRLNGYYFRNSKNFKFFQKGTINLAKLARYDFK